MAKGRREQSWGEGDTIFLVNKFLTSIRWRFIVIYVVVVLMAFSLVTVVTSNIIENNLLKSRASANLQDVSDFSVRVAGEFAALDAQALYEKALQKGQDISGRVLLLDSYGVVQVDSYSRLNGVRIKLPEIIEILSGQRDTSYGFHKIGTDGADFWAGYYASAIVENSEIIGVAVFSQSTQDVVSNINSIKQNYTIIYWVAVLAVAIISYFLTSHLSRPLEQLREGAMAITVGDFKKRVQIEGKDEIAELGKAFNTMTARLEDVDKQRSEFVSNASHELKTPLTSMKILTESILYQEQVPEEIYKDFLSDINGQIDRMTSLINDLLLMTRIESGDNGAKMEEAELGELVQNVVDTLGPIAEQKDILLTYTSRQPVCAKCFPRRLSQAIRNLVENAIKYTGEGGSVQVSLKKDAHFAYIAIADTGEGIAKEELDRIFERFYRVDKARARETGGSGLGLYLVRSIAVMHGGRVDVESEKGKGSVFTLVLPL